MTDSSLLLKHKHGSIFNRIRTQAGSFLFAASCLFKLVPRNNEYNGIIVDDLDQSISLIEHTNYKLNKISMVNYNLIFYF